MNLVIIGAGQSGRGYITQFIPEDTRITFIDKNSELIQSLNSVDFFNINYYGSQKKIQISNYQAYTWETLSDSVFKSADYIAVSVGEQNFEEVVLSLKNYKISDEVGFITFENGTSPASNLETLLLVHNIQFKSVTQCAIFTTTNAIGIDIISEDNRHLFYDNERFRGHFPFAYSEGIGNFERLLQRKIFTYNCLSAVICYPGFYYGFEFLHQATSDARITKLINNVLDVLNPALSEYFKVSLHDQVEFSSNALKKFNSPYIVDGNVKNGRDVERKMGLSERLFGPIKIVESFGYNATPIFEVVGFALYYNYILNDIEPLETVTNATGLDIEHPWVKKSIHVYNRLILDKEKVND